ncbi:MAG: ribosomal protein S18-alanine N-acetyltransferase [Actinomycetes bacterium]
MTELQIRPIGVSQLRAVLSIEEERFPDPWSRETMRAELTERPDRRYLGAFRGRRLIAYFGIMIAADEGAITNVAIGKSEEGSGLGSLLMAHGLELADSLGVESISLEVAVGNERAQALYRRFAFAPVGIRRGYYGVTNGDALVMRLDDLRSVDARERRSGYSIAKVLGA